jgi:hypothetical protein
MQDAVQQDGHITQRVVLLCHTRSCCAGLEAPTVTSAQSASTAQLEPWTTVSAAPLTWAPTLKVPRHSQIAYAQAVTAGLQPSLMGRLQQQTLRGEKTRQPLAEWRPLLPPHTACIGSHECGLSKMAMAMAMASREHPCLNNACSVLAATSCCRLSAFSVTQAADARPPCSVVATLCAAFSGVLASALLLHTIHHHILAYYIIDIL